MASQARNGRVAPCETFASRIVVPSEGRGRSEALGGDLFSEFGHLEFEVEFAEVELDFVGVHFLGASFFGAGDLHALGAVGEGLAAQAGEVGRALGAKGGHFIAQGSARGEVSEALEGE